jgi:phosphatidylglycerophosphate synthase
MFQSQTSKTILQSQNSLYEKFFPSVRDRRKELATSKLFQVKTPPCLNGCADGFVPNWITGNLILCPANWEYAVSDIIVPHLYRIGVDTPNKVTLMNCLTMRLGSILCMYFGGSLGLGQWLYWCLIVLLPLQQMIDCTDGQMARRYGLGSEFGAWFDHITDNVFGYIIGIIFLYKVFVYNDSIFPFIILWWPLLQIAIFGNFWIQAEERRLTYQKMTFLQKLGMFQMLFLSYYYMAVVAIFLKMGWLK